MFKCPGCGVDTPKLIGVTGVGLKCPMCFVPTKTISPSYMHVKAGLTGEAKNVTVAQKKHMWERTIGENNKVVMRSNPNREWKW